MKAFALLFIFFLFGFAFFQDECDYDSILILTENEKITHKQVTKLAYYSQSSRFAVRRDYHEIDLIFSSIYGLQRKDFESFKDRDALQSHISKKDYIIRIQMSVGDSVKLEKGKYTIGAAMNDNMKCKIRLYHLDKTKKGMEFLCRIYYVKLGEVNIEKLTGRTFCGTLKLDIPEFYNLSTEFSVEAISKDN